MEAFIALAIWYVGDRFIDSYREANGLEPQKTAWNKVKKDETP